MSVLTGEQLAEIVQGAGLSEEVCGGGLKEEVLLLRKSLSR